MQWLLALSQRDIERKRVRWYNAWTRRQRPYRECREGDEAFIITRTGYAARGQFTFVYPFQYRSREDFVEKLKGSGWGDPHRDHPYFKHLPRQGYGLAFHLNLHGLSKPRPRPRGWRMPQLGWLGVDDAPKRIVRWLDTQALVVRGSIG